MGPSVPNDPIAVRPGLDEDLVRKITDLFLHMDRAPEARGALQSLYKLERITRFVPARAEHGRGANLEDVLGAFGGKAYRLPSIDRRMVLS